MRCATHSPFTEFDIREEGRCLEHDRGNVRLELFENVQQWPQASSKRQYHPLHLIEQASHIDHA